MPGLIRIALLATAVVLAVALGACGAEDNAAKNDYVKQVNAAQTQFAGAVTKVREGITETSSAKQDRRALDAFTTTVDELVVSLRAMKVPEEVCKEHDRLVTALAGHREEVAAITKRMRAPTTRVLDEVQRQLSAATITVNARLGAATDAINTKLSAK